MSGSFGAVAEWLIGGIFCLWALLSIVVLSPKACAYLRTWDVCSLIPEWKFFAPNPAQGDFHLLYRDRLADGTITPWTEVRFSERASLLCALWNAGRREPKALFDAVSDLGAEARLAPAVLAGSLSFLTILNYVSSLPRWAAAEFTQFLILHSFGRFSNDQPVVVFLSELRSL